MNGPSVENPDPGVAAAVDELVRVHDMAAHRDELHRLFAAALHTAQSDHHVDDVALAAAALEEMARAFSIFAPYRQRRKVTIFGSARTQPHEPTYELARDVAAEMAERGWMVVTGAGPGIMAAATEGAGPEMAMGVSIRLPFEPDDNEAIDDGRQVRMRYFFTRKLMLVKESHAFISLKGGFGTLDETFELLTLQQTGKSDPVPIVLMEAPDQPFWSPFDTLMRETMVPLGVISADDVDRYILTTDCAAAADHIEAFYVDYDSIRYVDDRLVMRRRRQIDDSTLAELDRRFPELLAEGARFERVAPSPDEIADGDKLELHRLSWRPSTRHHGRLGPILAYLNEVAARA